MGLWSICTLIGLSPRSVRPEVILICVCSARASSNWTDRSVHKRNVRFGGALGLMGVACYSNDHGVKQPRSSARHLKEAI